MKIVTVARKPLGTKSTTENVVVLHVGALNVDDCRIAYQGDLDKTLVVGKGDFQRELGVGAEFPHHKEGWGAWHVNHNGRWPSNVILTHHLSCREEHKCEERCPVEDLKQSGMMKPTDGSGMNTATRYFKQVKP